VYSGIPSAKTALRVLLAAAELLDTRSLILVDAADVALTAPEITAFALATFKDGCDLVTPVLPRGPADGPLVTQLVRPVIRALWGRRIAEPLTMPMACSGRLAADMGRRTPWAHLPGRLAGELWVTSHGLCDGWRARQIAIAERPQGSTRRGGLVEIFSDITATLFESVARIPPDCVARDGSEDVPVLGAAPGSLAHEVRVDAAAEDAAFRSARALLEPLWSQALSPDTLSRVLAAADDPAGRLEDPLWARTVYEFLHARRRGAMPQGQLARALLPLYQGRVASFLGSLRGGDAAHASELVEALAVEFERQKPAWRSALGTTPR